ncbi:MAG: hypothetical protein M5R40_21980 [Anaerolineae bacterium]|nr:hypothetical protein [Anaerolineae bacterium]
MVGAVGRGRGLPLAQAHDDAVAGVQYGILIHVVVCQQLRERHAVPGGDGPGRLAGLDDVDHRAILARRGEGDGRSDDGRRGFCFFLAVGTGPSRPGGWRAHVRRGAADEQHVEGLHVVFRDARADVDGVRQHGPPVAVAAVPPLDRPGDRHPTVRA